MIQRHRLERGPSTSATSPRSPSTTRRDSRRDRRGSAELLGDARGAYCHAGSPEHGLTTEVLDATDVLLWWGHIAHGEVDDVIVERVYQRVLGGMGIIVLHSGHFSKIFTQLMGTTCSLKWRNEGERELVWTVTPRTRSSKACRTGSSSAQEMYGEYFDIPEPDELVFVASSRAVRCSDRACYTRGSGRVFYFSPGDQEYPVYSTRDAARSRERCRWAAPRLPIDAPPAVPHAV